VEGSILNELNKKRITHKTYEEAEHYLFVNYLGYGNCIKNGEIYDFIEFSTEILI